LEIVARIIYFGFRFMGKALRHAVGELPMIGVTSDQLYVKASDQSYVGASDQSYAGASDQCICCFRKIGMMLGKIALWLNGPGQMSLSSLPPSSNSWKWQGERAVILPYHPSPLPAIPPPPLLGHPFLR